MEKHFPKKAFFAFLFLAAGLLIFTLSAETLAQPKPIKAILNVPWGPETAVGLQHKDFVDLVTQKTNGRLQIDWISRPRCFRRTSSNLGLKAGGSGRSWTLPAP
jgi:hypothetical protein